MQSHAGVPLCLAEAPLEFAAADAWADENSAGIGAGGGRLVVQRRRHLLVGLAFNLNVPIFPLGFVLQSHHLGKLAFPHSKHWPNWCCSACAANFVTDTDPMC